MLTTRFTELVGCTVPIQQAGMGSFANPSMAAAVASAGGLGMVSVYGNYGGPPQNIAKMLDETRQLTEGVFGANFIMKWVEPEVAGDAVSAAAEHADVVEFFYTDPDSALVDVVHAAGALACWQVGSREEALAAEDAGCDFVIAQGIEAGGHIRGTTGLLALLDQVLATINVPVVAAGGIGSGRTMAAVLAAGADGVRVGTRFVAAGQADAHPDYVQALLAARPEDTVYTEAFGEYWPDAPHRTLRSSIEAAQAFDGEVVGTVADTWNGERYDVGRFSPLCLHKSATGDTRAMPMWAGESVSGVTKVQTAAEIVGELAGEAEALLHRWV